MTNIEALITKARKYCIDNYAFWMSKYAAERSGKNKYTDNDYNIFPRYLVSNAILKGVETFVGQTFDTIEKCKKELVTVGQISQSQLASNNPNNIEKNAIQEERDKFIKFITALTETDLENVEKLPYKRKLREAESEQIRQKLLEKWNFKGDYWYPIGEESSQPTIFLMLNNFSETDTQKVIQEIADKAENRFFVFNEWREDYEVEIDNLSIDLSETICFDKTYDWVIYCSHEMTITFGGNWLIDFVSRLFADRQDLIDKFAWD